MWLGIGLIMEAVSYVIDPGNYEMHFSGANFLVLILISLLVLPIQTSFEELFFRGYLLQGIGLSTGSRLAAILITSILFGCVHLMNPEISEFGMGKMMIYYIGVGIFLAIITLLDDSLELALGIHAATNFYGAVFVTFTGSALQTDALFRIGEVNINLMLIAFIVSVFVFFIICKRKYGWNDWSKVFGPVHSNSGSDEFIA